MKNELDEIIIRKIKSGGPISFHDFMDMSLYYPGLGYYTSAGDKIGRTGDYYTSPEITSLFGEMIGKQLEEMWKLTGEKEFTVIEYGAGPGTLCQDILSYLQRNEKFYDALRYIIIEKSDAMREKEKALLPSGVQSFPTMEHLSGVTGCILSNEVVDNFPVHQVMMQDSLMEIFVDYSDDGYKEVMQPAPSKLKNYFEELGIQLPKGFRTEVNLEAVEWIRNIATVLKEGFVMTIDYGFTSNELYTSSRREGTLTCFKDQAINGNPYHHIGEQDITTHINFSALNHWGSQNGLSCCGFTTQARFLHALGLVDHVRKLEETFKENLAGSRNKMLLMYNFLSDMSRRFMVLIQQKGLPVNQLAGLKFTHQYSL